MVGHLIAKVVSIMGFLTSLNVEHRMFANSQGGVESGRILGGLRDGESVQFAKRLIRRRARGGAAS